MIKDIPLDNNSGAMKAGVPPEMDRVDTETTPFSSILLALPKSASLSLSLSDSNRFSGLMSI